MDQFASNIPQPFAYAQQRRDDNQNLVNSMLKAGALDGTGTGWVLVHEVEIGNSVQIRELLFHNTSGGSSNYGLAIAPSSFTPASGLSQLWVVLAGSLTSGQSLVQQLLTAVQGGWKIWVYGSATMNYHMSGLNSQK